MSRTMNIMRIIKTIKVINLWKTIYFNFHYFPPKTAVRLPFFICWRTELHRMNGKIIFESPVSTGMAKIGGRGIGVQDKLYSRTIWENEGALIIKGKVGIGRGSKISIGKNAILMLGENFSIIGKSEIICQKEITFGANCLLSWDILIMDTDFHSVFDNHCRLINSPKPIHIGNHVWIGCRNTILKGISIADNVVVSANSTITRCIEETNCIVGGHGKSIAIIKKGISWSAADSRGDI